MKTTQETQAGKFTLVTLSTDFEEKHTGDDGLITIKLTATGLEGGASVLEWSEWVNTDEDGVHSLEEIDTQDSCGHNDALCWNLLSEGGERDKARAVLRKIAGETLVMEGNLLAKIWLADDKQSEIGYWSTQESDEAIWKLLKEQGHDGTGTIVTCEVDWDSCMSNTVLNWDDETKKEQ